MAAVSGVDLQALAPAVRRLAGVLAVTSLVPVVAAGRFGSLARRSGRPKTAAKAAAIGGLSFCCVFLLIASEACGILDALRPLGNGSLGAGKFQALLDGVRKGMTATKPGGKGTPDRGLIDRVITVCILAFTTGDAFEAARLFAMVTGLLVVLVGMTLRTVPTLASDARLRRNFMTAFGIAFPACVFGFYHQHTGWKTLLALAAENAGLLAVSRHALRVAALLAAPPPRPAEEEGGEAVGGTPPLFVAFQAASLITALSVELAKGTFVGSITAAQQQGFPGMLFENPLFSTALVPSTLALLWLVFAHLQHSLMAMCLTSFLSAAASPGVLAIGLPALQGALGLEAGPIAPKMLAEISSMGLLCSAFLVIVAGGTQSIMVVVLSGQLVARIAGLENLTEVFTAA